MNTNSRKTFSWKSALILSLGVGLVTLGSSAFFQTQIYADSVLVQAPATKKVETGPLGAGLSYEVPGQPSRLIIPAIGVDANIQSVGMWWRNPSEIGIPTNFTDVAWYNGSAKPGEPGSAVIDGHYDGKDVKEAVFYNLGKLKPSDDVQVVDDSGKTLHFTVLAVKIYAYNANTADIFDKNTSHTGLNLITCGGDWIKSQGQYNQRVVVFTELATTTAE